MITDSTIFLGLVGDDSTNTYYVRCPINCTLRKIVAVAQAATGGEETVTVADSDDNTLGVSTIASGNSAGDEGTSAIDSTNGSHKITAGEILSVATTAFDTSTDRVWVALELDPLCHDHS